MKKQLSFDEMRDQFFTNLNNKGLTVADITCQCKNPIPSPGTRGTTVCKRCKKVM